MPIWVENWSSIWMPETPLLEIFVRGTAVYLTIYALLRLILKRETANTGVADLLVIVLLADAAQNAMADGYRSITDGLLLFVVILGWAYTLDWLAYHVPFLRRLIRPAPLLLVQDGQTLQKNMASELLTEEELMQHLRAYGIEDVAKVARAYMESSGQITVIQKVSTSHRGR